MGVENVLFHNKVICIYSCGCSTRTLPGWFIWPALHSWRSPFQQFYGLCHTPVTSCGKRHGTDKCCDLGSTVQIVYHPPPVLSLQEREWVGLDYMNLFDGYIPLLSPLFKGSMQTSIKTVVHIQINCTVHSRLVNCNRGHSVRPSVYHQNKLYYLSTWQCCTLLN